MPDLRFFHSPIWIHKCTDSAKIRAQKQIKKESTPDHKSYQSLSYFCLGIESHSNIVNQKFMVLTRTANLNALFCSLIKKRKKGESINFVNEAKNIVSPQLAFTSDWTTNQKINKTCFGLSTDLKARATRMLHTK